MLTLFPLFYILPWSYLHHFVSSPPFSSTIPIHQFDCLFSSSPLPLYPSIPFSPARVFILAQPTAECLTRWKELGVKRQYCCQLWSLLLYLSLFLSRSDSRYISANVLLTSSTPMEYQQKPLSTFLITRVLKNARNVVRTPFFC